MPIPDPTASTIYADLVKTCAPPIAVGVIAWFAGGRSKDKRENKTADIQGETSLATAAINGFTAQGTQLTLVQNQYKELLERLMPVEMKVQSLEFEVRALKIENREKDGLLRVMTYKCRALVRMVVQRDAEIEEQGKLINSLFLIMNEQNKNNEIVSNADEVGARERNSDFLRATLENARQTIENFQRVFKSSRTTLTEMGSLENMTPQERMLEDTIEEGIEETLRSKKIRENTIDEEAAKVVEAVEKGELANADKHTT